MNKNNNFEYETIMDGYINNYNNERNLYNCIKTSGFVDRFLSIFKIKFDKKGSFKEEYSSIK